MKSSIEQNTFSGGANNKKASHRIREIVKPDNTASMIYLYSLILLLRKMKLRGRKTLSKLHTYLVAQLDLDSRFLILSPVLFQLCTRGHPQFTKDIPGPLDILSTLQYPLYLDFCTIKNHIQNDNPGIQ